MTCLFLGMEKQASGFIAPKGNEIQRDCVNMVGLHG